VHELLVVSVQRLDDHEARNNRPDDNDHAESHDPAHVVAAAKAADRERCRARQQGRNQTRGQHAVAVVAHVAQEQELFQPGADAYEARHLVRAHSAQGFVSDRTALRMCDYDEARRARGKPFQRTLDAPH
jgi:hypothetical protein